MIKELQGWESEEMVSVYSDLDVSETLKKYFDENGIKEINQTNLTDL